MVVNMASTPPTGLGTCNQCKYFSPDDPADLTVGSCRHDIPRWVGGEGRWQWPQCLDTDWCGEWEEIPAP
jgi:hypothetical protein